MTKYAMLRLCLLGGTGSGKSTSCALFRQAFTKRGMSVETLKLADPLYQLQSQIYELSGQPLHQGGTQDQILLETMARVMRRISPEALVWNLGKRLSDCQSNVVINDDLRDNFVDAPVLKAKGFHFIRIYARPAVRTARLKTRGDISLSLNSKVECQQRRIAAEYVLTNNGSIEELSQQISDLTEILCTLPTSR